MNRPAGLLIVSTAAVLLGGCAASPGPKEGFSDVQAMVRERTGGHHRVEWDQGTAEDRAVAAAVDEMLRRPLSVDDAVQVALLNNRSLQAQYEAVGIAQADLVQAGLLSNPAFTFAAQFPTSHGRTRLDGGISQNIMGLLFVPLRKKIAKTELEQAQLKVADAVLGAARDVEVKCVTLAARQQQLAMRRQTAEAAEAALTLARRQHQAGTATDLLLAMDEAVYQQARLELMRLELAVRADREGLNRLMGLSTPPERWTLAADVLGDVPAAGEGVETGVLEDRAVGERLDVLAARGEVRAAEMALGLGKVSIVTDVSPGASFERDTDGSFTIGPSVSAEVPLFDQGQGRIPRLRAILRQTRRRLEALEAEARSDVRLAVGQMATARQMATTYRDTVIPQQRRAYDLTRRQFNAMQATVHDLLQARSNELTAREGYVEAVRDYWIARADLERAVGGRLPRLGPATRPAATTKATTRPAGVPMPGQQGHHHHG
jgi:cobalt-zinc-cadmium efflux system outer membrane protein